ncbi:MAG: glycosyltransferase family 2 protein [Spirochaetaceae bacterium]|nr:glycosyltransferase family 2 protein [Spirochaetaceae bacterium]
MKQPITISICIPTYRRPDLLNKCLNTIINKLETNNFSVEIVVVDNDKNQMARNIVSKYQKNKYKNILYLTSPDRNISLARNCAVSHSSGNYIAFIDDDEYPEKNWLIELYNTISRYNSDGVLGPVLPKYAGNPPLWLVKSRLCFRESFPTGTLLEDPKYMRTGNVLFTHNILTGSPGPFDPKLGRSGGEDKLLFSQLLKAGCRFVWCNEANVYEEVPLDRQTKKYYINRAFIRGANAAKYDKLLSFSTIKSITAIFIYLLIIPFLFVRGQYLVMKYFEKSCNHISKILAMLGIKIIQEHNEL